MQTARPYPLRVDATLEPGLSRWLWAVKWLLAIPHYVVLFFLWSAFAVLSVVAFFAILFTGRYPRSIFDFNVGVLRWSWRVAYYAYGALGTDRYPPFTLAEAPGYPTHLEIEYPERLSRGLVLVKSWLLAIPHYLVTAVFLGGGLALARETGHWGLGGGVGLILTLVLVAGVVLAFTGRYPQGIFDLVLGLNRWVLRVAAYVGLMTDAYPPFRLDMGGGEPTGTLTLPAPPPPVVPARADRPPSGPGAPSGRPAGHWTGARIVAVVVGAVLVLSSLGLLAGGGLALWADRTQRDAAGFVHSPSASISTDSYALIADGVLVTEPGVAWSFPQAVLGKVRIQVESNERDTPLFVGIAPTARIDAYLGSFEHAVVTDLPNGTPRIVAGGAPPAPPEAQPFWMASSAGMGVRTIVWTPTEGSWTVVVMNADATRGVDVRAQAGATVPWLPEIAAGMLIAGVVLLIVGALLVAAPIVRASRRA